MIAEFAGNIAGLANIVPKADKLTFIPMMDIGPVPAPAGAPYTVMFNPEHLEHSERLIVIPRMPQGEFEPEAMYDSSAGETFNIQLMIDGTGASGEKRDVSLEIMRLKMTVGYNGILHMPNYLVIVWGAFLRTAICTDFSVKYTVFKPDGSPLRANVTLNFRKHVPKILSLLEVKLSSPDLTHRQTIKDGDRIDRICQRHYNDKTRYLEVAKANGLTSFRFLKPGTTLDLPPVEKGA